MTGALGFSPAFPWPAIAALGALALLLTLASLAARARGALLRLAGFLLILAILCGPQWRADTTSPLPDVALVLLDHSQSMEIGARNRMAARALAALRATAGTTRLQIADIPPADDGGTAANPILHEALAGIPAAQLAGVIAITDGEFADTPSLPANIPFTALLTANGEETDRELHLIDAPAYGLVGRNQTMRLVILDHGVSDAGASAQLTVSEDGAPILSQPAAIGQVQTIDLPIRHAGPSIITAAVSALPGEVSPLNNQIAFTMTGIQKRLNVLLISGSPDQGERAWRLLLKSDPAVQLVHFTILRTPGEAIDADPEDIALVPFPVRELFETDIGKFDLIILDAFNADGLLSPDYLGNIATYVQNGGALFAEVGPEFSEPGSLAFSPLAAVLPATPTSPGTITRTFAPAITSLGARHPVTAPFTGQTLSPWYRMEAAAPTAGNVLMTGPGALPLLILADAGRGRSGMLLSDQLWLWTRGGAHDGPALPLLRRAVHWLLREPALEAESLTASLTNNRLTILRQTLSATAPGPATLTAPDGTQTQVPLVQSSPGQFTASVPAAAGSGVWKISSGPLTAYAANTQSNALEYADLAATAEKLQPIARNILWLGQHPQPALSPLLSPRHATQIIGTRSLPLLPPLPTLLIALALILGAWWRERGARS